MIQELIDKALIRKPRERSGKFSPSSFGMCYRAQFWNRKDEPKSNPPDSRTLRVFKAGQLFEQLVKDLIISDNSDWVDCGIGAIECEDVKGFADLLNNKISEVADIKSQHSKSFWWMAKKNCDIKKEKYHNWLQVLYYARELNKGFGRLVFISKDDLCVQEYVQPLDDYWLGELKNELAMLRLLWKDGRLPPASPRCEQNKKSEYWMCNYCNWKDKCAEIEGIEKELAKVQPPM